MTENSVDPQDDQDQDSEPTMTAPAEGRPDGAVQEPAGVDQEGAHAQDADDQQGAESTD
jgi:hypothetical protein